MDGKCAVCNRVLDWRTNLDGSDGHWAHTSQDQKLVDHEPVWASEKDGLTIYRCDFCNQDNPEFEIPTSDFTVIENNAHSVEEWACCGECKVLIEARRWEDLIDRVLTENAIIAASLKAGTMSKTGVRTFLRSTYGELQGSMTGPPRPIT